MIKNLHFAVASGLCASTASTFGKICWLPALQDYMGLRTICFGCMLICNSAVWTFFVKALHQTDSSLIATVISSASNYVFSAITGFILFREITSLIWWSGMFLIILGLLLILRDNNAVSDEIKLLNKND